MAGRTTPREREPHMTTESWGFTESELQKPAKSKAGDVFVALPRDYEVGIMVLRNGQVTNRWADGTTGLTPENRDVAAAEETLYNESIDVYADNWRNVVVDNNGNFIRFA